MFVCPFPVAHFSCGAVSLCSYKYTNPSSGSFVSSNMLLLIRHSAFHAVAECFSSGENYFVFFLKKWHQDFAPFLFQGISAARSAITFKTVFTGISWRQTIRQNADFSLFFILCVGYYFIALVWFCSFFFWVLLKALSPVNQEIRCQWCVKEAVRASAG